MAETKELKRQWADLEDSDEEAPGASGGERKDFEVSTLEFFCVQSIESKCLQNVVVCTASREGGALAEDTLRTGTGNTCQVARVTCMISDKIL